MLEVQRELSGMRTRCMLSTASSMSYERVFAARTCSNIHDHPTIRISHAFVKSLVTVRLLTADGGNAGSSLLSLTIVLAGPPIIPGWPSKSSLTISAHYLPEMSRVLVRFWFGSKSALSDILRVDRSAPPVPALRNAAEGRNGCGEPPSSSHGSIPSSRRWSDLQLNPPKY